MTYPYKVWCLDSFLAKLVSEQKEANRDTEDEGEKWLYWLLMPFI